MSKSGLSPATTEKLRLLAAQQLILEKKLEKAKRAKDSYGIAKLKSSLAATERGFTRIQRQCSSS